jgi:hypothetical protein
MVKKSTPPEADILSYRHTDRRKNNPEVGMVTPATDPDDAKTRWQYDPHLDPTLSWTGKAERTSFAVDTVSLHVHERIDPASILSAVRAQVGAGETGKAKQKSAHAAKMKALQPGLFDAPFENLPLRDANNPDIDGICERLHPAVEAALAELNASSFRRRPESSSRSKTLGPGLRRDDGDGLPEWEVPFDFPEGADEKARPAFDAFHVARQTMQKAMDRSIADHADQETLYDQPAKSKNKLRITGPFSVEAVPFPTVQALDALTPGPSPKGRGERLVRSRGQRFRLLRHGERRTGLRRQGAHRHVVARHRLRRTLAVPASSVFPAGWQGLGKTEERHPCRTRRRRAGGVSWHRLAALHGRR